VDDPSLVDLDQRDLISIAKGVRTRSRPSVPRTFVLFAAYNPRISAMRDQQTVRIPRIF
jgi:hypothetical protein